jgi:hypothetical protein
MDEVQYLRKQTEEWTQLVRTGHIRNNGAWLALNTTIMKTIEYVPATTMKKSQINSIMQAVTIIGLCKSEICRNIARKVVYPKKYQRLGINYPYDIQGI